MTSTTQTHNLNKCDVTGQGIALIHFSGFFLKDMSKRMVFEDWVLALSKWMFLGPRDTNALFTIWAFKNIRGQQMKSLAEVVYPQWMGKHRKWTMTYAVNSSAPTAEWDVNSSFRSAHLEGFNLNIPHLDTGEYISTVRFHFEAKVLKKRTHTKKAAWPWNSQLQKW